MAYAARHLRTGRHQSLGGSPMRGWLIGLGIAAVAVLTTWGLLVPLARRLPPDLARDLAAFSPGCLTTVPSPRRGCPRQQRCRPST